MKHGTRGCYQSGCRCGPCTDANTEYSRVHRGSKPRKVAQHGTRTMYHRCTAGPGGTKCEACTQANRDYQREYMRSMRAGEVWAPMSDPAIDRALDQ